jgi:hypothetical protein
VLVGPLAIRRSRRKEKASKTEKVCFGYGLAFNLNQVLQSLTPSKMSRNRYMIYEDQNRNKNMDLASTNRN